MGVDIRSDLVEFGGFVIAFCAAIVAVNEPDELICPFVVTSKGGRREVIDFESETQADAVEKGWASLPELKDHVDFWGFGRGGLFPEDGIKHDLLVASLWAPGLNETISVIQRFRPKRDGFFVSLEHPIFLLREIAWTTLGGQFSRPCSFAE